MFSIPGVGELGVDAQKTKTDGGVGCCTVRDCMDMDASCRFNCSQLSASVVKTKGNELAILGTANWNGTRNESQHRGLVASRAVGEAC